MQLGANSVAVFWHANCVKMPWTSTRGGEYWNLKESRQLKTLLSGVPETDVQSVQRFVWNLNRLWRFRKNVSF